MGRLKRFVSAPRSTTSRDRRLVWTTFAVTIAVAIAGIVVIGKWTSDDTRRHETVDVPSPHPSASSEAVQPQRTPIADVADRTEQLHHVAYRDSDKTPVEELMEKFDPARDDWDTEALSDAANGQLKTVTKLISDQDAVKPDEISTLLADDFSCTPLGGLSPSVLREVFNDGTVRVQSLADTDKAATDSVHHGAEGLVESLRQLVRGLGPGRDVRSKLKLFRIEKAPDGFTTRILVEASNRSAQSAVQQNSMWLCRWTNPAAGGKPRLSRINLESYDQVEIKAVGGSLFTDCTESVLGKTSAYRQQVLRGIDHWLLRLGRFSNTDLFGHHGLAVGDVNGDGLDDVYMCDSGGLPNRLFVQNLDGTVTDQAGAAGVDWLEHSKSALLVDLDNDGDQDLMVTVPPLILIAENDGTGTFSLRQKRYALLEPMSMCAADYDDDGDLDIYLCAYGTDPIDGQLPAPVPYYDAENGGANILLRNDGGFQFTNATEESGLDDNNSRFSFAAAWDDYDNDGDLDLYVANDFGRNNLYRNDDGHFTDVAEAAGVQDIASGMSVSWGDYNRDGYVDVYVGNMFSSAGNRVAYQRRLSDSKPGDVVAHMRRHARGNTLFANAGDGTFRDTSQSAAVTMGRWAWSSKFLDLNNDGWQDLVVANGYVTTEDTGDL